MFWRRNQTNAGNLYIFFIKGHHHLAIMPNKKISVFRVTGLKILGGLGTHIFFFWKKKYNFMHFERHVAFQNV